jgi:hypothetical protein
MLALGQNENERFRFLTKEFLMRAFLGEIVSADATCTPAYSPTSDCGYKGDFDCV